MEQVSKSVSLVLLSGDPDGAKTAELSHRWTGKLYSIPRSDIKSLSSDALLQAPGIYFLVGDNPDAPPRRLVYCGQSSNIARRLAQHVASPPAVSPGEPFDFGYAVAVISKDGALHAAHAMYLERTFFDLIGVSARAKLLGGQIPGGTSLQPHDIADMAYYVDQVKLLLPILGYDFLVPPVAPAASFSPTLDDILDPAELVLNSGPLHASARLVGGTLIVRQDSMAKTTLAPTAGYKPRRMELIADGTLVIDPLNPDIYRFAKDTEFSSLSAAANVILGARVSGPQLWQIAGDGRPYREYLAEQTESDEYSTLEQQ